jgi:hypothetical protein
VRLARVLGWSRLAFGLQRWELLILGGGTVAYVGLGWLDITQLNSVRAAHPTCFNPELTSSCPAVGATWDTWYSLANRMSDAAWALPLVVGLVLGVPIVAREIEHGTGLIAWSLARSRTRWLAGRLVPILAATVLGLLIIGFVAQEVTHAAFPGTDTEASFLWYGRRGILVAVRGAAWLAVGLAVGAVVGRSLPALLLGAVLAIALFVGALSAIEAWESAVAVPATSLPATGLVLDVRVRAPDGRLITFAEADAEHVIPGDEFAGGQSPPEGYRLGQVVPIQIPGTDYGLWVARESAILGGVAMIFGLAAFAVVQRRRPS